MPTTPTIDAGRLWRAIHESAAFGARPDGGIHRLALTPEDGRVRDWFRREAEALGCTVSVDAVGNMFARLPGRRNDRPPIAVGSHLDTQPAGGKFDGVLGVLAGLEVLRALRDAGHVTDAPIEVVDWTNEEGARFTPAMLASGVFAGAFTPAFAYARRDPDGTTFAEALEAIGHRGPEAPGARRLGAYLELHIEQGPVLDAEGMQVGVVTGAQATRWYDGALAGSTGHTGTTPMHLRRDALVGVARIVEAVGRIAAAEGPDACATVGRVEVQPNSRNIIPERVAFSVDLRHPDDAGLSAMATDLEETVTRVAGEIGLAHELAVTHDAPATRFDPRVVAHVEAGAAAAGLRHRRIVSGAGHDAVYVARVAPTGMVFVPCRDGLSHHPAESVTREECAGGAQVLLNALLALDASLLE